MQTTHFVKTAVAGLALILFASCGDKMAVVPATLKITPKHHGQNISDCTVYIKYDTKDKPAAYDDSMKCVMTRGVPVATFRNLRTGNYYIYGRGFDPSIGENVEGGVSLPIHTNYDYVYDLSVTEGAHK